MPLLPLNVQSLVIYLSIGLLAIVTTSSYFLFHDYQKQTRWIDHTNQVLTAINKLQFHLTKETAYRNGFDSEFSTSPDKGKILLKNERLLIFESLDSLKNLTSDNPEQVQQVRIFSDLLNDPNLPFNKWLLYSDSLNLGERMNRDMVLFEYKSNDLSKQLEKIKQQELSLFNIRLSMRRKSEDYIPGSFLLSGLVSLLVLYYVIRQLNNELKQRKAIQKDMEAYIQQLNVLNIELERFAFLASHHLKEPLRKALTFVSKTIEKEQLPENALIDLNKTRDTLNSSFQLLDDLSLYTSMLHIQNSPEQVDLNQVLRNSIQDMDAEISRTRSNITHAQLPLVTGYPELLQIVFNQLISNSVKYAKPDRPPRIDVRAEFNEPKQIWKITFEDEGIGFDQQFSDKIFGVFERLHPKTQFEGTGVGLAICRRILEHHRGTIEAFSEPGSGTRFVLQLPA